MTAIQDLPNARDFGYEFNYSLWTAGTVVTLCNVPWNSDYRDIVRFDDQAALNAYLDASAGPTVISGATYARFGHPVRLSIPFNAAQNYNYLKVTNPAQPTMDGTDTPKTFYYFITDVQHIATNTTQLNIQVDVWQTFGYGVTFGNCYIERGHVGIANENGFDDYGREFLTIPEGMDIGGEYQIEKQWSRDIATARDLSEEGSEDVTTAYSIMVTTTVSLDVIDFGTVDAPKLVSSKGSVMENLPNGAEIYIFNTFQFGNFMAEFSDKPWITQGIISITAIPQWDVYDIPTETMAIGETSSALKVGPGSLKKLKAGLATDWRTTAIADLPSRYQGLKKLMTYPYAVLEMTAYTGTPLMIKPESWNDPDLTVVEVPHFAPPSPRLAFYPYRYNAGASTPTTDKNGVVNDGGEFLDAATGIFNFPTFSIVNSGAISYMAANNYGIAFQHTAADWSQQRALTGNQNSYNQASSGIGTSKDVNAATIDTASRMTNQMNENAGQNAILSGITKIEGGAHTLTGAVGMAATTYAKYAIDTNQNTMANSIVTGGSARVNAMQNKNAGYVRDTNRDYGDWAAKGDYSNTIAGIQAKVQDAKLIQPTTSGQVGGDAFNLATYKWGYDVKLKMINGAAMNSVGEYWLRYGYQINRFGRMPSSFQVMEKFTYWKLRETYIQSASCPESFKQALRGIFEKGVTVWNDPTDIGMIDIADNAPLTGVTL